MDKYEDEKNRRMTINEAQEIMSICFKHSLFCHEVIDEPPPSLAKYSLSDLLEAKGLVDEAKIEMMKCDDRGLAALYVAYHFPADDIENVNFIAKSNDGRVVVVLRADQIAGDE